MRARESRAGDAHSTPSRPQKNRWREFTRQGAQTYSTPNPTGGASHQPRTARRPFYLRDGRLAGWLVGLRFIKVTVKPEHVLRHPPGIAVDEGVLTELANVGCEEVVAPMADGRRLSAPLRAFREHGFAVDRGFGRQIALPLAAWTDLQQAKLQPAFPLE